MYNKKINQRSLIKYKQMIYVCIQNKTQSNITTRQGFLQYVKTRITFHYHSSKYLNYFFFQTKKCEVKDKVKNMRFMTSSI